MLFNSSVFLFWFLPAVLGLYYLVPARGRLGLLLAASYIFYGWWNPLFCGLMLLTTSIDYFAGKNIYASTSRGRKRGFLLFSVIANLSLLGFFKYYGMFSSTIDALTGTAVLPLWQIILPIGISFYTFQSMSYSLDIYRGVARPTRGFIDFACYVSLFPQLIAGPIVRYNEIEEQLRGREHTWDKGAEGAYRFMMGLVKKVLIADAMAAIADPAFSSVGSLDTTGAWLGLLAYSFQIYFDFSGYSDMAIGLGLMFGFRFPENFNTPYHSRSITEFWRRWHITLSNWVRDYIYIPLGGNREGQLNTLRNLFIVMFLVGLWHGAAWTFVAWGAYHGLLMISERVAGKRLEIIPNPLRSGITFFLVTMGWLLFRASSFSDALQYFRMLWGIPTLDTFFNRPFAVFVVGAGALLVLLEPRVPRVPQRYSFSLAVGLSAIFIVCAVVIFGNTASPFIYFQF